MTSRHLTDGAENPERPNRRSRSSRDRADADLELDDAALLREVIEHIPHMVLVKEARELRFVCFNRAGEELLGYDRQQLLGKSDFDVFAAQEAEALVARDRQVLREGVQADIPEERIQTRDNGERVLHTKKVPILGPDGEPRYLLGISEDVTELLEARRALQRTNEELLASRMQEAQKLEQLGVLAGGIAHDFNNLLVGILGNASLALAELAQGHPARRLVSRIEGASQQAAALTKQMLAYSGRGRVVVEPVDMGKLVRDVALLAEAGIAKTAKLELELEPNAFVEADATQLQQLIMNLVANASDALQDRVGAIDVRVYRHDRESEEPETRPWDSGSLAAGPHVVVEVRDTGHGMDEDTLKRVFEPFFTTKQHGHGLGLSAALGIVRGHGGAVRVQSEPGQGTVFRLSFPAVPTPSAGRTSSPSRAANPTTLAGLRVLVVDDEAAVRDFVKVALRTQQADAVEAEDGESALRLFGQDPNGFDLVILDLSMPNMGGRQCLEQLRALRSDVPVLLSSGFDEMDTASLAEDAHTAFLQKPYRLVALMQALRALLAAAAATSSPQ